MSTKPSIEDVLELSGIDVIHPGGLDITKRIGEIVEIKQKEVLDVACGRGILPCFYAKEFGAHITGIDLSPAMIDSSKLKAKNEGVEDLTEFIMADALDLPFEDNRFEVVINECAVGLTSDPNRCLQEMVRVTQKGGYVVLHENTWLKEVDKKTREDTEKRIGTVPYLLREWNEMIKAAGLVNVKNENWSGLENILKMRTDRKVKKLSDIFTIREALFLILPKIISRFGFIGLFYLLKSESKINPLYKKGYLGYYLFYGQKI